MIPTRMPISVQARGQLRVMWSDLEVSARRIEAAIEAVPPKVLNPANWKGRVGTERAIAKIVAAMPIAPDLRSAQMVVWRYLSPVAALPMRTGADAEPDRPGILVKAIIAGRRMRPCKPESFGVAFSLHSLGRLLDRSGFVASPVEAMLESHNALTSINPTDGDRIFDLESFEMPAFGGAFLASPGRFGPNATPIAIARTWVSQGQTFPRQDYHLAAWSQLLKTEIAA